MNITFLGAAQNVTGSKHLIEIQNFKILLDCGLHQGKRSEAMAKNREFPFNPKDIDAVLLSHGHADHCGMIPLLVKQGFKGKVYATPATTDIARYIMSDSAKLQEQDADYYNDRLPPGEDPIYPLYTVEDVENCLPYFAPTPYFRASRQWTRLNSSIRFKFYDAGHILGSSSIVLELTENNKTYTLLYTGDLGHKNSPLIRDPEFPEEHIDILVSECTYGNRLHKPLEQAGEDLARLIIQAARHKSKVIVPAFSLGRTQELVYVLHQLTDQKKIPRIPIYIDSPLAGHITEVFSKYEKDFDQESWQQFGQIGEWPLTFRNLIYTHTIEDSKRLNTLPGPFMVISASGMCEGGRILHHLKNNIEDPNNIIIFTGFQAMNTLGRKIIEGISPVRIFGRFYEVKAQVFKFNEFSAHADQAYLLEYLSSVRNPSAVFLVHTETQHADSFVPLLQPKLPHAQITVPADGQSFEF